jgi:hypothetical protein
MKVQTILLLAFLQLAAMCQKDKEVNPSEKDLIGIDLENPVGRFLYYEMPTTEKYRFTIFEFAPGNNIKAYNATLKDPAIIPYEREGDRTIRLSFGGDIVFHEKGKVTTTLSGRNIKLLPETSSSQLAGKTFTGTYLQKNGAVLHQNFFYTFSNTGNQLQAGFQVGNPERGATYTPIGPWGVVADVSNGDRELMVLVDGKLEADFYARAIDQTQTATLTESR